MSARGQSLQGRKVIVKLIDGTKIVDIFQDNSSRHVILKESGRIRRDQIKKIIPFVKDKPIWLSMPRSEQFDVEQSQEFPNLCPIKDWVQGTFVVGLGGTGARYIVCGDVLSADGVCKAHGKVRFTGYEKPDKDKPVPGLRYQPPRRKQGGRTVARMTHVKKVMGW